MLTVTDAAMNALQEHFVQRNINLPIRITLTDGCCKGENLRFTLCKLRSNDLLFTFDSITFLIDRGLAEQYGAIRVDFEEVYDQCQCTGRAGGFSISSERFSGRCGWAGCCETCAGGCNKNDGTPSAPA